MPTDKTFKVGKDVYDIPAHEVANFLKDNPQATEVQSFVMGKDTFDIPLPEVSSFIKDVPDAKPLKKKNLPYLGVHRPYLQRLVRRLLLTLLPNQTFQMKDSL